MKKQTYMTTAELWDFCKIGVLAQEAQEIAEKTPVKEWRQRLKTCSTLMAKTMLERLEVMDEKQRISAERRKDHTTIRFISNDAVRIAPDRKHEPTLTISTEMLFDILDLAILSCFKCPQGECVKGCKWREHFHTLSIEPMRTEVAEGECEYSTNKVGEAYAVTPQYQKVDIPDKR